MSGKVVGEFVCDGIFRLMHLPYYAIEYEAMDFYFLRISNLKIYDKPKEVSEFRTPKNPHRVGNSHSWILDGYKKITHPPKGWCYVEELQGENE